MVCLGHWRMEVMCGVQGWRGGDVMRVCRVLEGVFGGIRCWRRCMGIGVCGGV